MAAHNGSLKLEAGNGSGGIQITINIHQPGASGQAPQMHGQSGLEVQAAPQPMGIIVRQVLADNQGNRAGYITTIPLDGAGGATRAQDAGPAVNPKIWKFLRTGDPDDPTDVDTGVLVVQLNDDASGVATWLPNDPAALPETRRIQAPQPGGPETGVQAYLECCKQQPNGCNAEGFKACAPHLLS